MVLSDADIQVYIQKGKIRVDPPLPPRPPCPVILHRLLHVFDATSARSTGPLLWRSENEDRTM